MIDIRQITIAAIKLLYEQMGGIWGDINLFGIRDDAEQEKDLFNDFIGICCCSGDIIHIYEATTDPGTWWTKNPITAAGATGAAHLCEGFHKNAWRVGIHAQGTPFAHEALIQTGYKVKIWRDSNSDYDQDQKDPIQDGYFGINIHRAGLDDPNKIGKYSAGCQVLKNHADFEEFMKIIKSSDLFKKEKSAARFSYLLVNKDSL